jgi:regulatory protein
MKSDSKYSYLEAKAKLEALCAAQERCSCELQMKMNSWGISQQDGDALLAHLIANNFLNEERFAAAFVSGKVNIKKWGKVKIRHHLKQKFISDYSINCALNTIDDEVYQNHLTSLAVKKFNLLKKEKDPFTRKGKVYKYLLSKGYETDSIRSVIDTLN